MITKLFVGYGFHAAIAAGLLVTAAAWRTVDVSHQRAIGAEKAVATIEKATNNAVQIGAKAAAKSASPAVGGVRKYPIDPTARND